MNFKSDKGIAGIDITVSIIIITVFVSIITALFYTINLTAQDIERKREATSIAIKTIENLKTINFEDLEEAVENGGFPRYYTDETNKTLPYYEEVIIADYADLPENQGLDKINGLVKKVTVKVSYKVGKDEKNIEISIIRKKGE